MSSSRFGFVTSDMVKFDTEHCAIFAAEIVSVIFKEIQHKSLVTLSLCDSYCDLSASHRSHVCRHALNETRIWYPGSSEMLSSLWKVVRLSIKVNRHTAEECCSL